MLTVVCQFNTLWQTTVSLIMQANVVTHVREQGATCPYTTGKGYGIVNRLVGVVRTVKTKGIDHKHFDTAKEVGLTGFDGLHVGDIGEATEAEAKDGQLAMHHADG